MALDKGDAFFEHFIRGRQRPRAFQGLDRLDPLGIGDGRLTGEARCDGVLGVEREGAAQSFGRLPARPRVEQRPAEADPRSDVLGVLFETVAEDCYRFPQLPLSAQVLAELEENPGGRVLPEFEAELLESVVHEI